MSEAHEDADPLNSYRTPEQIGEIRNRAQERMRKLFGETGQALEEAMVLQQEVTRSLLRWYSMVWQTYADGVATWTRMSIGLGR